MTCKFFTILHTYFRCCVTRENTDNIKKDSSDSNANIHYYNSDGEYSPFTFTFDDLSRPMITNTSTSTNSSSSSLNDYETQQSLPDVPSFHSHGMFTKRTQAYKQSYFQPFIGVSSAVHQ